VEICREQAIILDPRTGRPSIDPERCLSCGQCIRACPSAALVGGEAGYRILIGGKLGRHPQLGRELEGIFLLEAAVRMAETCIVHYLKHHESGERFGEVLLRFPWIGGEREVEADAGFQ
jgi:dissimilatory sulfite reductase (desulfoviridin) alpha/beta subunit